MAIKTNTQIDARLASPRACLAFSALDSVRRSQPDEPLPTFSSQRHRLPPRQRNPATLLP